MLHSSSWSSSQTFKSLCRKETQTQYYIRRGAAPEVNQLVQLDSKPFGSEAEKMLRELFDMGPRTSTQNDGTRVGRKIEIKCARYWAGQNDCRWQHLEPEHDYEFAMLALLDFHGWKVWCIPKALLMGDLRDRKIVTFQGKQGWWTQMSRILPHLTPIHTIEELDAYLSRS